MGGEEEAEPVESRRRWGGLRVGWLDVSALGESESIEGEWEWLGGEGARRLGGGGAVSATSVILRWLQCEEQHEPIGGERNERQCQSPPLPPGRSIMSEKGKRRLVEATWHRAMAAS